MGWGVDPLWWSHLGVLFAAGFMKSSTWVVPIAPWPAKLTGPSLAKNESYRKFRGPLGTPTKNNFAPYGN